MFGSEALSAHVAWTLEPWRPRPLHRPTPRAFARTCRRLAIITGVLGLNVLLGDDSTASDQDVASGHEGGASSGSLASGPVAPMRLSRGQLKGAKSILDTRIIGTGPRIPSAFPEQDLRLFIDRAELTPGLTTVRLPLDHMHLVAAECLDDGHGRKQRNSPWRIRLRGDGYDVAVFHAWGTLALMATIGGWPEPA